MKKRYVKIFTILFVCTILLSACKDNGDDNTQIDTPNIENANENTGKSTTEVSNSNPEVNSTPADWDIIPDTDFDYEYDSELQGVAITGYHGSSSKVRFPDTINGDPVVNIDLKNNHSAFGDLLGGVVIEDVYIPKSVTCIGNNAFRGCTGLNSITLPDSVTNIGIYSFYGCTGLTEITLPDNVTSIGCYAFADCEKLSDIKLPDTAVLDANVFDNTYWYNRQLEGFLYIGNTLLGYKGQLSDITIVIPKGVTVISGGAFSDCTGLTSITIPDSVTSIGGGAFRNCTGLTSIVIPNSMTSIGSEAFSNCASLTSINIPDSMTEIHDYTFRSCTGMTSITIPDSVTKISSEAFGGCISLDKASKSRIRQINPDVQFD